MTQNTNTEGLRSIFLEIENFKGISKCRVDINGSSLLFMGKNESGKSTLIQAMISCMDSKFLPEEPIKKGEQSGKIIHKIAGHVEGVYKEYTMEYHFTPKNKKGRLVVRNEKDEIVSSPATIIKNIIGAVSFDVTSWLHQSKSKKIEMLKNLTGNGKKIDLINQNLKQLNDSRKVKESRVEELKAVLNNHEFNDEQKRRYSRPMDVTTVQQELSAIGTDQNMWDDVNNQVAGFRQKIVNLEATNNYERNNIQGCYDQIRRLQEQIKTYEVNIANNNDQIAAQKENIQKGEQWLAENPRPSLDEINNKLAEVTSHNEKHNRICMLQEQHKEMTKLIDELNGIETSIKISEKEKLKLIESSQLPVKGLSFTDEELFLDDLPLDESQINTARLWKIGTQIAMALNPKYKGIFLPDASLFDKDTLREIISEAEARGYFVICEIVDFNKGPLHVEFAETILN